MCTCRHVDIYKHCKMTPPNQSSSPLQISNTFHLASIDSFIHIRVTLYHAAVQFLLRNVQY